ncbi:MAG: hypothetical protein U0271_26515 [Polyangiaceae bacterium]
MSGTRTALSMAVAALLSGGCATTESRPRPPVEERVEAAPVFKLRGNELVAELGGSTLWRQPIKDLDDNANISIGGERVVLASAQADAIDVFSARAEDGKDPYGPIHVRGSFGFVDDSAVIWVARGGDVIRFHPSGAALTKTRAVTYRANPDRADWILRMKPRIGGGAVAVTTDSRVVVLSADGRIASTTPLPSPLSSTRNVVELVGAEGAFGGFAVETLFHVVKVNPDGVIGWSWASKTGQVSQVTALPNGRVSASVLAGNIVLDESGKVESSEESIELGSLEVVSGTAGRDWTAVPIPVRGARSIATKGDVVYVAGEGSVARIEDGVATLLKVPSVKKRLLGGFTVAVYEDQLYLGALSSEDSTSFDNVVYKVAAHVYRLEKNGKFKSIYDSGEFEATTLFKATVAATKRYGLVFCYLNAPCLANVTGRAPSELSIEGGEGFFEFGEGIVTLSASTHNVQAEGLSTPLESEYAASLFASSEHVLRSDGRILHILGDGTSRSLSMPFYGPVLHETRGDQIWVGGDTLATFSDGRWVTIPDLRSIQQIGETSSGTLVVTTWDQLWLGRPAAGGVSATSDDYVDDRVTDLGLATVSPSGEPPIGAFRLEALSQGTKIGPGPHAVGTAQLASFVKSYSGSLEVSAVEASVDSTWYATRPGVVQSAAPIHHRQGGKLTHHRAVSAWNVADLRATGADSAWIVGGYSDRSEEYRAPESPDWPAGEGVFAHLAGDKITAHRVLAGALLRVAVVSDNEAWAVGAGGSLVHVVGDVATDFTVEGVSGAPPPTLRAVLVLGPNDVWVAGDDSTVLHWDGKALSRANTAGLSRVLSFDDIFSEAGVLYVTGPGGSFRVKTD